MQMRPVIAFAFAIAVASGTSVSAATVTTVTLYNTGVDASGVVLPDGTVGDPHYSLVSVPGGTSQTLVRTSAGGYPIPPYLADDSISAWIGPNNTSDFTSPVGTYEYQTTFNLAGFNPSTASISGQWSSDNEGLSILLNGNSTGNSNNNLVAFESWTPFSISTGFVPGVNTLDFFVNNSSVDAGSNNPTALRVEMTGTAAVGATPLPSTWTMLIAGFAGLGFLAYRGTRKNAAALTAA